MIGSLILLAATMLSSTPQAQSQQAASASVPYTATTVLLGPAQVIGALYRPSSPNPNESTALFLTHENDDFIGSIPCVQLAQRGFTVLCVKSQYADQAQVDWDGLALDVSASVSYLRSLPTVKKVVLVGWSGGGAIMSYYQNVSEHGVAVCQAPALLDPCGADLAGMPPADGVVLLDAIPGIAFADLTALDASVLNEQNLRARNENLDMFASQNGYDPTSSSNYSGAFVDQYTAAQGNREAGLVTEAQQLRDQIANGEGQYPNDAPMPVGRDNARIWQADNALISHTQGEYPLISPQDPNGGTPQVIHSVR